VLVGETIVDMPEAPSLENVFTLTLLAPLSLVCEPGHGGRGVSRRWAQSGMALGISRGLWTNAGKQ
jgi:hypothetical protein